jgi:DNA repair exonuclease SbcCD ATPase subunit
MSQDAGANADPNAEPMDRVAEELYALPPDAFVAARDELARTLRDRGDRPTAAAVKALRRPTLSVWAANRLSRSEPDRLRAVVDAGAELEEAQRRVLAGEAGAGRRLRELTAAARRGVAELVDAGAGVLTEAGHQASDPVRDRLAATLNAAIATEEGRAALAGGRLTRDLDPAAFGFGGGPPTPAPAPPRPAKAPSARRAPARPARRGKAAPEAEEREAAERTAAEREAAEREAEEREAARRAVAEARELERAAAERAEAERRAAEDARGAADEARARAARLEQAAAGLREAAEELAERARSAAAAAERAAAEVGDLAAAAATAVERSAAAAADLERARQARQDAERREQ